MMTKLTYVDYWAVESTRCLTRSRLCPTISPYWCLLRVLGWNTKPKPNPKFDISEDAHMPSLIPGLPANWPANLATVAAGGSVAADNAPGLSTVTTQAQTANPGVAPAPQSANQSLTTFTWLPTSTLKASAPGVPIVTQAS